jgi:quinol monooxygenase YgiN
MTMLIAIGHFSVAPDLAHELLEDLNAGRLAAMAGGAVFYHFAIDDADSGGILVSECWADRASLDRHLQTPHMAALLAKWAHRMTVDVLLYDASNPHRLGD